LRLAEYRLLATGGQFLGSMGLTNQRAALTRR